MNLWYKFLKLKTWQKLGLGIAILSIFRIFAYHNFIIMDVQAQTSSKGFYKFFNNETSLQINDNTILSDGAFASNYLTSTQLSNLGNSNATPFKTNYNIKQVDNTNNILVDNNFDNSNYIVGNGQNIYTFPNVVAPSSYDFYLTGFTFNYYVLPQSIYKNHTYTIATTIFTTGLDFQDTLFSNNDYVVSGTYAKNHDTYSLGGKFDVVEIGFFNPDNQDIYTNNHYCYFYITIELNDSFPSGNDYYLKELSIQLDNPNYLVNDIVDLSTYKYFTKSNGTQDQTIMFQFFQIMEDVDTYLVDNDNYSIITGQNINMTGYEQCDNLDIACHLRNLVKGIKSFTANIMHSIYALFSKIFIPDFENISLRLQYLKAELQLHFPNITGFITYLNDFVTSIAGLEPRHSFSFSGVQLPGYSTYIIPAFTVDFDSYLENPTISFYYGLSRTVLMVIVMLGYCIFCMKLFEWIFHDVPMWRD